MNHSYTIRLQIQCARNASANIVLINGITRTPGEEEMNELRSLLEAVRQSNIHLITQENLIDIIHKAIDIKAKSTTCNCDNHGGRD